MNNKLITLFSNGQLTVLWVDKQLYIYTLKKKKRIMHSYMHTWARNRLPG